MKKKLYWKQKKKIIKKFKNLILNYFIIMDVDVDVIYLIILLIK